MRFKSLYLLIMMILMGAALSGCFPFGPEEVSEFDVVATFYNENYNFSAIKTYAMPDSVAHISSGTSTTSRAYDDLLLEQVAANMKVLGYEHELDPETNGADVLLTVSVTNEDYNVYSSSGYSEYWGWYGGYEDYSSGYGYSYPGYGGSGYSVQTGTVIVRMLDPNNPSQDDKLPTEWLGLINGLTDDTTFNVRTRLVNAINQLFVQSTYLGTSQ